jgi:hypothetical protein
VVVWYAWQQGSIILWLFVVQQGRSVVWLSNFTAGKVSCVVIWLHSREGKLCGYQTSQQGRLVVWLSDCKAGMVGCVVIRLHSREGWLCGYQTAQQGRLVVVVWLSFVTSSHLQYILYCILVNESNFCIAQALRWSQWWWNGLKSLAGAFSTHSFILYYSKRKPFRPSPDNTLPFYKKCSWSHHQMSNSC